GAGDGAGTAGREPGRGRRWAGLAATDAEHAAAERRRRADRWGGGRVDRLPDRCRATVCGTLRSVRLCPTESSCTLEAELCDGTGTVLLVWLGRRRVPGLEPGRSLRVHGTVTDRAGRRIMYNPRYELLPVDA
ncbi:MAG: OB-fold nucleic acid binding domain-containing protein, partial [Kineosporiaceae bacterium]